MTSHHVLKKLPSIGFITGQSGDCEAICESGTRNPHLNEGQVEKGHVAVEGLEEETLEHEVVLVLL